MVVHAPSAAETRRLVRREVMAAAERDRLRQPIRPRFRDHHFTGLGKRRRE
jgi:hypothetical protein